MKVFVRIFPAVFLLAGCATWAERNLPQTYVTKVTSEPSGAMIEVDGKYTGKTPVDIRWAGRPGRYFQDGDHIIKAYPEGEDQCARVMVFNGWAEYSPTDTIPEMLHFDMTDCQGVLPSVDVEYAR